MQDIMYDPQTSGGLLIAVAEKDAAKLHHELVESGVSAAIIGYVTEAQDYSIILR
jgi:selenide,water dikinase